MLLKKIFDILAPHQCLNCGREGNLLCGECQPLAISPLPSRCYRCHRLTTDNQTCEKCRPQTPLKYVWVASHYDGILKDLLQAYKFERAKDVADVLVVYLDETAPFFPSGTVITHIPTATSRVRERGYDQARELAATFAQKRNLRMIPLLHREGQTRQVGAIRAQRVDQLANAFRPRNAQQIKGATIILIDDIVTTGATLESAARVLKRAGAKSVHGLVIAQKQ